MVNEVRFDSSLPRSTPEEQHVSSASILSFLDRIQEEQRELHSLMILRHGKVIAEGWWHPYKPELRHMLYSLSKSFTSTAVGFAVTEGKLTVDDKVASLFPDDLPASPSENLLAMTVRDLLCMATGHETEANMWEGTGTWVQKFLAHPVPHKPGSHFLYNTPASYMLSAILAKVCNESLLDYLASRLFGPLRIIDATSERSPEGICTGGYGLSVKTEDIAKFGQLYLQKGEWKGKQLLDPAWIEAATSAQVSNGNDPDSDWAQGYGYQFWRCRNNAYRGDGAFGQYCIVLPELDAVVAITGGLGDMGAILNLLWSHVLPGFDEPPSCDASVAAVTLPDRLRDLQIAMPKGNPDSPMGARINGRSFDFEKNELGWKSLTVAIGGASVSLAFRNHDGTHHVQAKCITWYPGESRLWPGGAIDARFIWTDEHTLVIRIAHVETPYINTYTMRFDGKGVDVSLKLSAGFGPTEFGPIRGE